VHPLRVLVALGVVLGAGALSTVAVSVTAVEAVVHGTVGAPTSPDTGATGTGAGVASGAPPAPGSAQAPSAAAGLAVAWALGHVGDPYRWGATGPLAFDCSGLTQAAYAAAGVRIPRVAQDQYDAGPRLSPGTPLAPGDLVFFGTSARAITHVGMAVGDGDMVDAPHTGADVRVEPIFTRDYVGASRPSA
jgi:cell wall-associated NlpC family hydrolase